MLLLRSLRSAFKSLLLHKLRSGLTMLGIVFGVFSVIAMLAIGEGASAQAQAQVLDLGATNIIVRSVKPPDGASSGSGGQRSRVLRYGLTEDDYQILRRTLPTVSLTLWRADAIVLVDWLMSTDLDGVPADHPAVKQALTDLLGRLEVDTDVHHGASGTGITQAEIDTARAQVAKDMSW